MNKYQNINLSNQSELSSITVGDKVRINDWRTGLVVIHRTENYLLLKGKEYGKEIISVVELLPSKYTHNNREEGYFTAGGDFWLFGWSGWYADEPFEVVMNKDTMEAYLRSFESGETEFSRRSVAVKNMQVLKAT